MPSNSPTFSLLVPCYNAEHHIDHFLNNFSGLTTPFNEILFYDDASTDETARMIDAKGFRVMKGEVNRGPGYARNRLAEASTCDYIHFHDIDDEIRPDFLELAAQKIGDDLPEVILGNAEWLDSETRKILISWHYAEDEITSDPPAYFITHPLGIINTVYRRESFLNVSGFNERLHCWEDADLHVRLALAGASFSVIDQVLAYSIRHNNGISKDQGWCWSCRASFLEGYARQLTGFPALLALIGKEFEKAAYELLLLKRVKESLRALTNSRQCGHDAPSTGNAILKSVKKASPKLAFLLRGFMLKFA